MGMMHCSTDTCVSPVGVERELEMAFVVAAK
jgi:hypothetical protein